MKSDGSARPVATEKVLPSAMKYSTALALPGYEGRGPLLFSALGIHHGIAHNRWRSERLKTFPRLASVLGAPVALTASAVASTPRGRLFLASVLDGPLAPDGPRAWHPAGR